MLCCFRSGFYNTNPYFGMQRNFIGRVYSREIRQFPSTGTRIELLEITTLCHIESRVDKNLYKMSKDKQFPHLLPFPPERKN